jgi:hypothetical protein
LLLLYASATDLLFSPLMVRVTAIAYFIQPRMICCCGSSSAIARCLLALLRFDICPVYWWHGMLSPLDGSWMGNDVSLLTNLSRYRCPDLTDYASRWRNRFPLTSCTTLLFLYSRPMWCCIGWSIVLRDGDDWQSRSPLLPARLVLLFLVCVGTQEFTLAEVILLFLHFASPYDWRWALCCISCYNDRLVRMAWTERSSIVVQN